MDLAQHTVSIHSQSRAPIFEIFEAVRKEIRVITICTGEFQDFFWCRQHISNYWSDGVYTCWHLHGEYFQEMPEPKVKSAAKERLNIVAPIRAPKYKKCARLRKQLALVAPANGANRDRYKNSAVPNGI
jgi:hypothetical protein